MLPEHLLEIEKARIAGRNAARAGYTLVDNQYYGSKPELIKAWFEGFKSYRRYHNRG